ncbi:MAG TPA: sugar phosphate nucleotidyltransferase [Bryobacteraceae bacterium]|nr:sugar phosphate nucleotidyltransferase [Bryobacteraceae bacterium]
MWGIIPAAGKGSRIQPLAFSKELLPLGERHQGDVRRPRAVSDFLVERLVIGGATRICFVISPGKSDILEYYGGSAYSAAICYSVQPRPTGLCDAIFSALPFIDARQPVLVGLPDTIWFPADALARLPDDRLSFLLFPVARPESFDAVVCDRSGSVIEIQVKQLDPLTHWVWGAFKMPGAVLHSLFDLWCQRDRRDEYVGTLVNAWLARGGVASAVHAGHSYYDVGTMDGYFEAMRILADPGHETAVSGMEGM